MWFGLEMHSHRGKTCAYFRVVSVFIFISYGVEGVSHWIATDDGEIKPQVSSIFSLRSPGDLSIIYRQAERLESVKALRKELLERKEEIERCEEEVENVEEKLYAEDTDCQAAGTPLTEIDLYVSTVVPFEVKLERQKPVSAPEQRKPDCTRYLKTDFTELGSEYLAGIRERHNLTMIPETGIHKALVESDIEDIEQFGEIISGLLDAEETWSAFNLAALYWREKGSAPEAIDCLRRAIHVSPREVKDVSLISLANVLHRSHFSEQAALIAHAAIEVAPDNPICHFTLGNIYAVLGEYNESALYYHNTLKLQPEFHSVRQRFHAVNCHAKVESALERQHEQLQIEGLMTTSFAILNRELIEFFHLSENLLSQILDKLKDYQQRKELYVQLVNELVDEAMPPQGWHKDCDKIPKQCKDCEVVPGFPFYDDMLDLHFNVRSEDKERSASEEKSSIKN